jgi:hypothetical protein
MATSKTAGPRTSYTVVRIGPDTDECDRSGVLCRCADVPQTPYLVYDTYEWVPSQTRELVPLDRARQGQAGEAAVAMEDLST